MKQKCGPSPSSLIVDLEMFQFWPLGWWSQDRSHPAGLWLPFQNLRGTFQLWRHTGGSHLPSAARRREERWTACTVAATLGTSTEPGAAQQGQVLIIAAFMILNPCDFAEPSHTYAPGLGALAGAYQLRMGIIHRKDRNQARMVMSAWFEAH